MPKLKRQIKNNPRSTTSCSFYSLYGLNPNAVDEGLGKCNKVGYLVGYMGIKTDCCIRREI